MVEHYFSEGLTGYSDRSFRGGLAHGSYNITRAPNRYDRSIVRSADRESQDRNLVGSLG